MSKLETPMTRAYWETVGGTLVEEFCAVKQSKTCGCRLIDGVILPSLNMLNPKRDCAFKFADKINVVGKEIIVYLQEGAGSNETETPEAGKSAFQSKPMTVFTREQVKIRLDDGTVVTPQADIATPVTVTGKVRISDSSDLCTINAAKIEKR